MFALSISTPDHIFILSRNPLFFKKKALTHRQGSLNSITPVFLGKDGAENRKTALSSGFQDTV
ncbi:MAG: hypothetical protein A2374_04405 [Candidatus Moranbacteria bacterium RIFOXYB1_FULL_44_23]|nr:MAG: hypothetical protein UW19_C0035G0007 [Candidatus Moranbacteria bacterium GW2011_GWF2_44_10]OGI24379.1 MAG: hypothetical protein A2194_02815 [Candidatus Moranbacteria bacterium RIFOXYA1_FULL_44_8]OGI35328.1 MAG: hypothetical protein A2407_00235 [Candidatus Moranbacteria bacterium RIFOXYC1_FULL_44_8]OGI40376.1 MAG: hypothetical protein A2374_04405 [Candidatus Moranbacteria bacterium RIFOXYB1_FULL_44_23]OGI42640.1 MAG: hypothetical protein A2593_01025 [Candidatus Moranbacteria bacterium RI